MAGRYLYSMKGNTCTDVSFCHIVRKEEWHQNLNPVNFSPLYEIKEFHLIMAGEDPKDWEYISVAPLVKAAFKHYGNGLFELILLVRIRLNVCLPSLTITEPRISPTLFDQYEI